MKPMILVPTLSPTRQTRTSAGVFEMSSVQEDTLRSIAMQGLNSLAEVHSQNILRLVFRDSFPIPIDEEEIYFRIQTPAPEDQFKNPYIQNEIVLVPNPASEQTIIKISNFKNEQVKLIVYNLLGTKAFSKTVMLNEGRYVLNTSGLVNSIYIVRILFEDGTEVSTKLIISR